VINNGMVPLFNVSHHDLVQREFAIARAMSSLLAPRFISKQQLLIQFFHRSQRLHSAIKAQRAKKDEDSRGPPAHMDRN
jgi:hypothetical protein